MAVQATILSSLRERLQRATAEPERLSLQDLLCRELSVHDPLQALTDLKEGLALAEKLKRTDQIAAFHELRGQCLVRLHRPAEARSAFKRAGELFESVESGSDAVRVYRASAKAAFGAGHITEAVRIREQIYALNRKEGSAQGMMETLKELGDLQGHLKNYTKAFEYYQDGLAIAESLEDSAASGLFCLDLGAVAGRQGRYADALVHINRALGIFREAGHQLLEVRSLVNLSAVLAEQGNVAAALDPILKALVIYDLLGERRELASVSLNAGELYEESNHPESALNLYLKSLDLFEKLDDDRGRAAVLLALGNFHRKGERYHDALWFLENALHLAETIGDVEREAECREFLAFCLERIGDASGATRHLWKYIQLTRRLYDREQQQTAAEMQARFDLERAEKEQQIWKLKSRQLESEMQQKSAELTSLTLQLVEKHRFIEELLQKVEAIEKNTEQGAQPMIHDVLGKIRRSIAESDDWSVFEEQFAHVHADLLHRIAEHCPALSQAELRVCALIVTGLSISEIAALLCKTERTIETYRYRIRKRLELSPGANLATYLQGL